MAARAPATLSQSSAATTARGSPRAQTLSCALWALAVVLLAFGWQAANVHCNYSGNWTALFCVGANLGVPPALAFEHIVEFTEDGFDGQYYHTMAHDPLMRRGFTRHLDLPR